MDAPLSAALDGPKTSLCTANEDDAKEEKKERTVPAPTQRSRVGDAFQVSIASLPDAKLWIDSLSKEGDSYGTCIWDSNKARASPELELLEKITPHDRRETAMNLFHDNGYKIEGIVDVIMCRPPNHGMHWPPETKAAFSQAISDEGKDFTTLSKKIQESVGDCINFYYSYFKHTSDYARLKYLSNLKQRKERDLSDSNSFSSGECARCGVVGELLCCDTCDRAYHLYCLTPPLDVIPEGDWYCEYCESTTKAAEEENQHEINQTDANEVPE